MSHADRDVRVARELGRAGVAANRNAIKAGELAVAANKVSARRMALGAEALRDPSGGDYAEFAKIIPEKASAISEMNVTLAFRAGDIARQAAGFSATEMAAATTFAMEIAMCRDPARLLTLQRDFALSCTARCLSHFISIGAAVMRAQGAALSPFHRASVANARRLDP
jgi:hypothetical protein